MDEIVMRVWMRTSSTLSFRNSSASSRAISSSVGSRSDTDGLEDLVRVDLSQRGAGLVPGDLALRGVTARDAEEGGCAQFLRNRKHPLQQLLEERSCRAHTACVEIDELTVEPVADGAPKVLLDEAARMNWNVLAVVESARYARNQRIHERGERLGCAELGLPVTDPNLRRREGQMRPHAPPDLGVLDDRFGVVEETDVPLVLLPAPVGVRYPAARKHAREDLRSGRVQVCVAALGEGRAGREGKQLGQVASERVADGDGAVGAANADVNVHAERVVAPGDVAKALLDQPVVRRVDDRLVLPGAPRVRAGRAERDSVSGGQLDNLAAALRHRSRHFRERVAAPRAHLYLGGDELSDEVTLELGTSRRGEELFEAADHVEAVRIEDGELLLDRNREVTCALVLLAREAKLLYGTQALGVTH